MNIERSPVLCLLLALVVVELLGGCGETFKPPSYVDELRILAVRAEAPELQESLIQNEGTLSGGRPPSRTEIRALVADPAWLRDSSREVTVLYVSCTPDPLDPFGGGCTSLATVENPGSLQGAGCGSDGPSSVFLQVSGAEVCRHGEPCRTISLSRGSESVELPRPAYVVPDGFTLANLPIDHPARVVGVQAVVIAIAVVATPDELLAEVDVTDPCAFADGFPESFATLLRQRDSITAVKRMQLRGPDAVDEPNVNPAIEGMSASGFPLPEDIVDPVPPFVRYRPDAEAELQPLLPPAADGLVQRFTRFEVTGKKMGEEEEEWRYSWYATAGSFERLRTWSPGEMANWRAPTGKADDPIPPGERVFVYVVLRDGRGGLDWVARELRVE